MNDGNYEEHEEQDEVAPKTNAIQRAQSSELAAQAVGARVQALVQAKFVMAAKMPRSLDEVRAAMKKRCQDPEFAAKARYCVERGNKKDPISGQWVTNYIEGPSIRFVEEMTQFYGNIDCSTTTLYDDEDKRIIRCEALDLERNTSWSKEITVAKTVERKKAKGQILGKRVNSYGDPVFLIRASDDDMATKEGAAISKTLRTLALRLLPGSIVSAMEKIVMQTIATEDAKNPDAARLAVLDGYQNIGITPAMLAEYLGHPTDTLSPEEIKRLRGFGVALAEGSISWRDLMDTRGGAGAEEADPEAAAKKAAKEAEVNKKVQATIEKKKAEAAAKKGAKAPEAAPTPKPEGKAPPDPAKPADGPTSGQPEPGTHDGAEPPPGWEPGQ